MIGTKLSSLALALIASAALAACSRADNNAATDTTSAMSGGSLDSSASGNTSGNTAVTDETLVRTVSAIDLGEVDAGQLAKTKATNADVKSFANMMVSEHSAMSRQDGQIASGLNIDLQRDSANIGTSGSRTSGGATPGGDVHSQVVQMNQQTMQQLRAAKKGSEFDRAYIDSQVQGHQMALQNLQQFSNSTQNQDLKNLVQNAIPKVQEHLDRARQIQQRLGQSSQGTNPS